MSETRFPYYKAFIKPALLEEENDRLRREKAIACDVAESAVRIIRRKAIDDFLSEPADVATAQHDRDEPVPVDDTPAADDSTGEGIVSERPPKIIDADFDGPTASGYESFHRDGTTYVLETQTQRDTVRRLHEAEQHGEGTLHNRTIGADIESSETFSVAKTFRKNHPARLGLLVTTSKGVWKLGPRRKK